MSVKKYKKRSSVKGFVLYLNIIFVIRISNYLDILRDKHKILKYDLSYKDILCLVI